MVKKHNMFVNELQNVIIVKTIKHFGICGYEKW